MKTINSFSSKLLALTLALMASVSSFAYEFEYSNDFHIDGFAYKVLPSNTLWPYGAVALIEIADCAADVIIPDTITYTFSNTTVTYIVTTLGGGAALFTNSAKETVKSISIPKGISVINSPLFAGCSNLTSIVVDSENPYYDSRENCNAIITTSQNPYFTPNTLIAGCKTTIIPNSVAEIGDNAFYNSALESITIPTGTTKIGRSAFNNSILLSSITLSATLIEISDWAFADCLSLNTIICYAIEPPTISSNTFFGSNPIYNNPTIYVPAESVEAYKNADQWKDFGQILPIEPTTDYKSQWCNEWNVMFSNGSVYPPSNMPYRYQLAKDTVIGEHTYTAVVQKEINDALDAPQYVAAVRFTDDRKVYIYYDNAEYLLYDFNVQEGDELEVFAGINNYRFGIKTYKCIVTGVEQYACIGCPATITLHVPNHPDDFTEIYRRTQWQEGVGDVYSGFLNGVNGYVPVDGGGSVHLLCAYQGDELKYTGPLYEEYGCGDDAEQSPEDLFPTLWALQRTSFTEYFDSGHQPESEPVLLQAGNIKEIGGKLYLDFGQYLREENGKIYIYSELLQKDFVLYDFTLELGDTLTTLNWDYNNPNSDGTISVVDYAVDCPIDTLIVTDISTITLLDGKEYKKWIFNHGYFGYVESIGTLSGLFYELSQSCMVVPGCYMGDHLVCASRNGKLLYQMDDAEMERLGAECLCEVETSYKSQWCDTWNLFTHSGGARLDSEETWQYKLDRDTIINGKLYSTVIYYLTSDPSREYYMGAVRFGDDRKVYRAIGNSESVVYDFTAQVGDTLGPGVVYDVEVDSLTNLKTIYFHPYDRYEDKYIEYATVKWIEGVGSTDGFLLAKDYGTVGGASFYLLCAYCDDELKYAANKELGCRYNAGEVTHEHFPTLAGLSRTIHEERSTNDTTRRDDFTKVVLDLSFPTLYHSQMYLRERDNKIFVESRTYKNLTELYEYVLYDFTLEVGDSLPMLYIDYSSRGDWGPTYPLSILNVVNYRKEADGTIYPGDTLVVTEVSTITLLDGKEYKKWTFNNGMEYAEGIGSLSGDFYELIANKRTTEDLTASQLVCASQNGQLLYKMDDAEMERLGVECLCEYNSGPKKDNAKNGKIGGRPTPTQWNMLEFETKEVGGTPTITRAETFSYTLENDSIVAKGKTFYQLARQSTKDTAITKSFVGALHFGEDEDNRVYFLRDGVEYVLYDFTAEPGDTIEIFAGINNYPQETTYTHVVTGKDTLENGACRMMLEVVFPDETSSVENAQKVWLAGLGSIDGIVHNAATRATKARSSETQTSVMLCAWRDDDCLYTTNHPEYDTFGCVYNQDPTAVENLTSPSSYQKILREGQLLIMHDGKIYTIMGIEIK